MRERLLGMMAEAHAGEEGHTQPLIGAVGALVGGIALGIGAAIDNDVTTITGGVVLGLGVAAGLVMSHEAIDKDMWARLEKLEEELDD